MDGSLKIYIDKKIINDICSGGLLQDIDFGTYMLLKMFSFQPHNNGLLVETFGDNDFYSECIVDNNSYKTIANLVGFAKQNRLVPSLEESVKRLIENKYLYVRRNNMIGGIELYDNDDVNFIVFKCKKDSFVQVPADDIMKIIKWLQLQDSRNKWYYFLLYAKICERKNQNDTKNCYFGRKIDSSYFTSKRRLWDRIDEFCYYMGISHIAFTHTFYSNDEPDFRTIQYFGFDGFDSLCDFIIQNGIENLHDTTLKNKTKEDIFKNYNLKPEDSEETYLLTFSGDQIKITKQQFDNMHKLTRNEMLEKLNAYSLNKEEYDIEYGGFQAMGWYLDVARECTIDNKLKIV